MSAGFPVDDLPDDPADDALDIGEEVGRLTEALAGWWTSVTAGPPAPRRPAGSATDDCDDHHDHDDHHDIGGDGRRDQHGHSHASSAGESCRVCPLCRALDIARAARPDLLTQVAAAAEAVALLLREAAAGGRPAEHPGDASDAGSTGPDDGSTSGTPPWPPGTPIVVRDADQAAPDQRRDAPWD